MMQMTRYRIRGWADGVKVQQDDNGDYVLHAAAERAVGELRVLVETLAKAARDMIRSPILIDAGNLVKGWNGTKEQKYPPHPFELGANLRTCCGEVYALDLYTSNLRHAVNAAERYLAPEQAEQKGSES